jgi:hypothetical protein
MYAPLGHSNDALCDFYHGIAEIVSLNLIRLGQRQNRVRNANLRNPFEAAQLL